MLGKSAEGPEINTDEMNRSVFDRWLTRGRPRPARWMHSVPGCHEERLLAPTLTGISTSTTARPWSIAPPDRERWFRGATQIATTSTGGQRRDISVRTRTRLLRTNAEGRRATGPTTAIGAKGSPEDSAPRRLGLRRNQKCLGHSRWSPRQRPLLSRPVEY